MTSLIPNVKHFKVFGCAPSILLTTKFDKLSARSILVTFIGYDTQSKAYRVYDIVNEKVYISRNVRFNESVFGLAARHDPELVDDLDILLPQKIKPQSKPSIVNVTSENALPTDATSHSFSETTPSQTIAPYILEFTISDVDTTSTSPFSSSVLSLPPPPDEPTVESEWFETPTVDSTDINTPTSSDPIIENMPNSRPITSRSRRPLAYWKHYVSYNVGIPGNTFDCNEVELTDFMEEQLTFNKAFKTLECHASMVDELNSIHKNRTWTLVRLPHGAKSITCNWVFRVKEA